MRHKMRLRRVLQEPVHGLIVAVCVHDDDGAVCAAELLQREHLEKFLLGADAAREDDGRLRALLHEPLALTHGVGIDHFGAVLI